MSLIANQDVKHGDIRLRSFDETTDGQDSHVTVSVRRLFDNDGVNVRRIGADLHKALMGGSPINSEISEIAQTKGFGGQMAMELDHLMFVIQTYRTERELAKARHLHYLLQMNVSGASCKIGDKFLAFRDGSTGTLHDFTSYKSTIFGVALL